MGIKISIKNGQPTGEQIAPNAALATSDPASDSDATLLLTLPAVGCTQGCWDGS